MARPLTAANLDSFADASGKCSSSSGSTASIISLDRYLMAPLHEAPISAVKAAASAIPIARPSPNWSSSFGSSRPASMLNHSSEAGSESRYTSAISSAYSSASSTYSVTSSMASRAGVRKKGKRRFQRQLNAQISADWQDHSKPGNYFCTFCLKWFSRKWEWIRHESIHAPSKVWVCCATPIALGTPVCPFCGEARPTQHHLERHNIKRCFGRGLEFNRRDHLVQHIRQVHCKHQQAAEIHPSLDYLDMWWSHDLNDAIDPAVLWCGFCEEEIGPIKYRADHLQRHFIDDGLNMDRWIARFWNCDYSVLPLWSESTGRAECRRNYLLAGEFLLHLRNFHGARDRSFLGRELLVACSKRQRIGEILN